MSAHGHEHARDRELEPDHLSGAIYGQVVATATTLGLSFESELGPARMAAFLVATMVVFWVAHVYAELLSAALLSEGGTRVQRARRFAGVLAQEWPVAQAALPGAIVLLLAAAGLWSRGTAVTIAVTLGLLALFAWGVIVGHRRASWPKALLAGTGAALLGALIVLAEVALH